MINVSTLQESDSVEFKAAQGGVPKSLYETYSAFANGNGGRIYLGIRESSTHTGIALGVKDPARFIKEITDTLNNKTKVSWNVLNRNSISIETDITGLSIIVINVPAAPREAKPVYIDGNPYAGAYIRMGEGDYLLGEEKVNAMIAEKAPISYDAAPNAMAYGLESIDDESLKSFKAYLDAHADTGLTPSSNSNEEFLKALRLINNDGVLTNAALLLFGKKGTIESAFPGFMLSYEEQSGPENRWDFRLASGDSSWSGNLWDFFRLCYPRIESTLPRPFKLDGAREVGDDRLSEAVREGFMNSIFNADFRLSSPLRVVKTPTSIIIQNPGSIRVGAKQAIQGGLSDPRNRSIMTVFRLAKLGERAGYGVYRIYHLFAELDYPMPSFLDTGNPPFTKLALNVNLLAQAAKRAGNELDRGIIDALSASSDWLTIADLAEKTGTSARSISSHLSSMIRRGFVVDNGHKTTGRAWKII